MIRARERVRDDAALVGEVSSAVSAALGLDVANRTLGRQVVIAVSEAPKSQDKHVAEQHSQLGQRISFSGRGDVS